MSRNRCVNFEQFDQFVFALSKFEKCILKIVTEYIYVKEINYDKLEIAQATLEKYHSK